MRVLGQVGERAVAAGVKPGIKARRLNGPITSRLKAQALALRHGLGHLLTVLGEGPVVRKAASQGQLLLAWLPQRRPAKPDHLIGE